METNKFDLNLLSDGESAALEQEPTIGREEEEMEEEPEIKELSPPEEPLPSPSPPVEEASRIEPKVEPERIVLEPKPVPVIRPDFTALAKRIYESEEEAPGALEEFFNLAKAAAKQEMGVFRDVTEEAVEEVLVRRDFEGEVLKMKAANPWIEGKTERYLIFRAAEELETRKISPTDLPGLLKVANDVLEEGKQIFKIQAPRVDPGSKPNTSKLDEIEKLEGVEYEEAFANLTPAEREALLNRGGPLIEKI